MPDSPCPAPLPPRLYRLIQNLEAYLPCALAGAGEWAPPAGWDLVSMLNITEPDGQQAPFGAILLDEEASQLVVALRGTMLPGEWALDFSYKCASMEWGCLRSCLQVSSGMAGSASQPALSVLGPLRPCPRPPPTPPTPHSTHHHPLHHHHTPTRLTLFPPPCSQTEVEGNLFGSPVHYGFGSIFEQLWPDVQAALTDFAVGSSPAASQVKHWC